MLTCYFENNSKAYLRHVTVNAVIIKDNQILLGKRGTFKGKPMLESGKWGLLGGYLNRDEGLFDAVKREVMEESGWEIKNIRLLRVNDKPDRPKEDRQNLDMVFIAEAVKKTGTSDEEVKELKWFDLDALPPADTFAFDHLDNIICYKEYLGKKFFLPVIG